jgi:hypothetical protein
VNVTGRRERVASLAFAADITALGLLGLGLYVLLNGGFSVRLSGVRLLSFRSEARIFWWAAGLVILRHLVVPRPPFLVWMVHRVRALARAAGPLRDDDQLLGLNRAERLQPGAPRRRRLLTGAAVTLLFAGLTAFMTYPQVRILGTGVSPDIGDPLLSTWRLSWIAHQIVRDPVHLFDANIFYPSRHTLAFSDAMLVPALMAAPLVWLGVPQLVAYNLLFLSGFALSGIGMFVLVRSLTRNTGAALIAGFVFAYLPFRYMHYAHLELQMAQWMPLCLWALHRTFQSGRLKDGLLTGLFFALQALSSLYYAIFLATFLVPLAAVFVIATPGQLARSIRPLGAGAVLAAVLITPVTIPYFAARASVGERPAFEIGFYSATPQDYMAAHPRNAMYGELTAHLRHQERELFQGVFVPLIALVALWPPLSAARIGYLLAMLLAFEASLGFNGFSYNWLHAYVLPYRGLRVPARMAMLVGLSLSILVGYGVARLTANRSRHAAAAITAAIGVLIFLEYRPNLTFEHIWSTPPPVYDRLKAEPPSVLLELPLKSPDIYLEPVYMYFSTFHWHRLVNGYSGFSPPSYARLLRLIASFPDGESIAELRRRHVDFVVVHGALYEDFREYRSTVVAMDRNPDFELVGMYPWEGRETRLYRLLATTNRAADRHAGHP